MNTFFGKYNLSIYNIDGTLAQSIDDYEETAGLVYNKSYTYPYLDFSNPNINLNPGTYILAMIYQENNQNWNFCGANGFQNPMYIKVLPPPLNADKYEQNNTLYWSYNLPVSMVDNKAIIKTEGANIHTISDKDFYKIIIPAGANYTVKANLIDANNSSGNMEYTLDAIFKYSTNGTDWSTDIDGDMNAAINVGGGQTFYINVLPNIDQEMGSYDLEIEIIKNNGAGISSNFISNSTNVFPNPAKDNLTINSAVTINQLEIYNLQGQLLFSLKNKQENKQIILPIETLSNGFYFLKINTDNGFVSKKITIEK